MMTDLCAAARPGLLLSPQQPRQRQPAEPQSTDSKHVATRQAVAQRFPLPTILSMIGPARWFAHGQFMAGRNLCSHPTRDPQIYGSATAVSRRNLPNVGVTVALWPALRSRPS